MVNMHAFVGVCVHAVVEHLYVYVSVFQTNDYSQKKLMIKQLMSRIFVLINVIVRVGSRN